MGTHAPSYDNCCIELLHLFVDLGGVKIDKLAWGTESTNGEWQCKELLTGIIKNIQHQYDPHHHGYLVHG